MAARPTGRAARAFTPRTLVALALAAVAIVVMALLPQFIDSYYVLVVFQVLEYIALAQAWNLLAGYGGLVSLAPATFVGLGAYAAAGLGVHYNIPLPLLILAGGVVAAVFAIIVSIPMFRFRGLYFAIATLVLATAVGVFMVNWNGLGGAQGLFLSQYAPSIEAVYYYSLFLAVLTVAIVVVVLRTRLGLSLRALRDDEDTAQEMGVSTFRTKLWVWTVSAFLIGMVGALQAARLGSIEPYGIFSLSWTINIVSTAMIGGLGSILGPMIGAGFTVWLGETLSAYPEIHVAITGAIVIVVIRFVPGGLWGLVLLIARLLDARVPALRRRADARAAAAAEEPDHFGLLEERGTTPAAASGPAGEVLIKTAKVTKRFGDVVAVSEVDLEVRRGEVLGIIGPNGAGKSTFVGMLSGALHADGGSVVYLGEDVTHLPAYKRARMGIGRTHQIPRPFQQMTVMENLLVARYYGGRSETDLGVHADCEAILHEMGLWSVRQTPAADLTLLQLKRLELARALALEPRILLMDEIGAGLVESEVVELIEVIHQLRHRLEAIVIIEHIMDVIQQCCDRVAVLDFGRLIADGAVQTVLATPEVVSCYLGTACEEDVQVTRARTTPKEFVRGEKSLLVVDHVTAGYGHFRALTDVSFTVAQGEVVALLGTNGAGKTTCARVISGMIPASGGTIAFGGVPIQGRPAYEVARRGLAHCMEGRHIFADLSVHENLVLAGTSAGSKDGLQERLDRVYTLFDVLAERRNKSGKQLSGGQQQMLAIGRALMADPKLVIFDEIALGLAPATVDRLYDTLVRIRDEGTTMILIEQNVERGLSLADRVFVLEKGSIALGGTPDELRGDPRLEALYMGETQVEAQVGAGHQKEDQ